MWRFDINPQEADALCEKGISFGLLDWSEEAAELDMKKFRGPIPCMPVLTDDACIYMHIAKVKDSKRKW